MISQSTIQQIITSIIDKIEAGYYHPDMKSQLKNGELMGDSGETMFGMDRKNGAPQFTTKTIEAMFFWNLVDANFATHHGDTSYYGDMADGRKHISAAVGSQLRTYVAAMIMDAYNDWSVAYLSDGARQIVENNPKTMLQFLYAVWNGPGNFQKFANAVNAAYNGGDRSPDSYYNIVQAARRAKGGLFSVGADKLDAIAAQLPSYGGNGGGFGWLLLLAAGIFGISILTKSNKKKR